MLILLTMVIGAVPVYAAEGDTPSSWAKDFVEDAIEKGYVPAHLQGSYQQPITREEFAELFVTAVFSEVNKKQMDSLGSGYKSALGFNNLTVDTFLERVSTSEVFTDTENKYVKVANIFGMVNGVGGGKFNPDGLITREQAAIMFVNYFQTVYSPGGYDAYETLSDIEDASSWAEDAVAWAYGAGFLNGTRNFKVEKGKVIEKGFFDTKGSLTREQAIIVISRLGSGSDNKDVLNNLIIRGYLLVGLEHLTSGLDVRGDTIYLKSSDYDYKYSAIKELFRTQTKLKDIAETYTSAELLSALLKPNGAQINMLDTYYLNKVLSGNETLYDYKVFTIEHNVGEYSAVITKTPGYGYMAYAGGVLAVDSDKDGEADTIITGVEVK